MTTVSDKRNFGIPSLSRYDIESEAERFILEFDHMVLERPSVTPLLHMVGRLETELGLKYVFSQHLGLTVSGNKVYGKTCLEPLTLFVDATLQNDPRFRFVLAHELGHVVLHRKIDVKNSGYADQELVDTKYSPDTGNKLLRTNRDWIEWQANAFASAMLMPRNTFKIALIEAQRQLGISRDLGHLFIESPQYSIKDYYDIQRKLQIAFDVNSINVEYRLKTLGLVTDNRDYGFKRVSQIMQQLYSRLSIASGLGRQRRV